MTNSGTKKRTSRGFRIAIKILLGIVGVLLVFLLLINVPPIQQFAARKAGDYLSKKTNSTISFDQIRFSLSGKLSIEGILALDPEENHVLSVNSLEVEINPLELLRGEYRLKTIYISGFDGTLTNTSKGLNIDYLIQAFKSKKPSKRDTSPKPFSIAGDIITLRDINFSYRTAGDSLSLSVQGADVDGDRVIFSTSPGTIAVNALSVDSATVDIFMHVANSPEVTADIANEPIKLPSLNFGIGYTIDANALDMYNSSFSLHMDEELETAHLNPAHLDIDDIRISAVDMSMHEEEATATIDTLSAILPVIKRVDLRGQVDVNMGDLSVSDLVIKSAGSQVTLNAGAQYPSWLDLLQELEKAESQLSFVGKVNPGDLSYFLPDTFMTYMDGWDQVDLDLLAQMKKQSLQIKKCDLEVNDSHLSLNGNFKNLQSGVRTIRWQGVNLDVEVGSAFRQTIMAFTDDTYLPDSIYLQTTSTGTYENFDLAAQANTNWGNITANGGAGIHPEGLVLDLDVDGENVNLTQLSQLTWLDKCNFSFHTTGTINQEFSLHLDGRIRDISILDQTIHDILLDGGIGNDSIYASIESLDSMYQLDMKTELLMGDQITVNAEGQLDQFNLGRLIKSDTGVIITGGFATNLLISDSLIDGYVNGSKIIIRNGENSYTSDSLELTTILSPDTSMVNFASDDIIANYMSNFDMRAIGVLLDSIITSNFRVKPNPIPENAGRSFEFAVQVKNDDFLELVDVKFEEFEGLILSGQLDQNARALSVVANTGEFEGLGFKFDTVSFNFLTNIDELKSDIRLNNIEHNNLHFGDLEFHLYSNADTSGSDIHLVNDSVVILDLVTRLAITDDGLNISPKDLVFFDRAYQTSWDNPILVSRDSFDFDQFKISDSGNEILIDGNTDHFDISMKDIQLKILNPIISPDSTLINSGRLNGNLVYNKAEAMLDCELTVDDLRIAKSIPMQLVAEAHTENRVVPFNVKLSSKTNNVELTGNYSFDHSEIDATLALDVNNVEIFQFATQNFLDKMSGSLTGNLQVKGPISKPDYHGVLSIKELQVVAAGTGSTVNILDENLRLDASGLKFEDFTIFDQKNNPLVINGAIKTDDYKSLDYDLNIYTDNYILLDQPRQDDNLILKGLVVVASDIKLTGNQKDTYLDAKVIIKDATNLTLTLPKKDVKIITDNGIVQFRDPTNPLDSVDYDIASSFYDSLIATLPSLNLKSAITLEKNAKLKVVLDPRAGDYIEASGAAALDLKLDRTGNLQLNGDYTITKGFYQLSFYGIAKKKFEIAPQSKIQWQGNPTNGDLDIVAIHRVKSSSLGLLGDEIGENEQSIYRKALTYEVGIVIKGTIENPQVSFTLDLPDEDKINYPALNSKLGRLSQPEFESELNKQVFGLLVMGGFIPETAGADMGELAVATTISNSVSSLLSSQLNRFVNNNIEGLEFDVGLQSYSDYSSGGSKTRSAMDFRVTKRMANDRLSFEVGAEVDLNADQSGTNTGQNAFRGDVAVVYDLTESGNKKLKAFNNESYDIIYHEIRNTGIAIILIKEFDKDKKNKKARK